MPPTLRCTGILTTDTTERWGGAAHIPNDTTNDRHIRVGSGGGGAGMRVELES